MYKKDEYKQLKADFWTGFSEYCAGVAEISMRKPFFMLYDTKVKGVELKFDLRRDSVDVALEVNGWGREEMFAKVKACRGMFDVVMESLKEELSCYDDTTDIIVEEHFVRETKVEVSRIYVRLTNVDFNKQGDNWQRMYEFMALAMLRMEEVFYDVRELISDEDFE